MIKHLSIAVTLVTATFVGAAQDQQPSFRTGTSLVPIYVTAMDESGRLIPDLTADDFEVRDNGRKRPLDFFTSDVQPFSVVVMLDRSGSMADHFDIIRDAASEFVGQMLPADRARIGSFSEDIRIDPNDFTGDQDELRKILHERLQDSGPSPVWTAVDRSITAVQPRDGRRVVLVFSDGHDDPGRNQVRTPFEEILRKARTEEIMIYAIGFSGEAMPSSLSIGPIMHPGGGRFPVPPRPSSSSKRIKKPDRGLRTLAEESGGGYFELEDTENLKSTFARVAEELHRQYLIAISPERLDGSTHQLEVKVKRPSAVVQARKTYVAEARK
jgi:Ca-activated chloride channel homolog